jgi:hypothetical protein
MSVFTVTDGDLVRDRQGFTRTSGIPAIAQDLRIYLRGRQGEIPTRTDLFLPWQTLLQVGVTTDALEQVIGERGVLTRPGIVAQETTVEIDDRVATVTIGATVSEDDQRRRQALVLTVPVAI